MSKKTPGPSGRGREAPDIYVIRRGWNRTGKDKETGQTAS